MEFNSYLILLWWLLGWLPGGVRKLQVRVELAITGLAYVNNKSNATKKIDDLTH